MSEKKVSINSKEFYKYQIGMRVKLNDEIYEIAGIHIKRLPKKSYILLDPIGVDNAW